MTTETKAAFSRRINKNPSYVRELELNGRIVLDGKLVDVEKTIALMESSRDPSRSPRSNKSKQQAEDDFDEDDIDSGPAHLSYQDARTARENWNARLAEIEYRKAAAELVEIDAVTSTVTAAVSLLRERFESLGAMLSQQLAAESDAGKCQRLIDEYVEAQLAAVSAEFKRI